MLLDFVYRLYLKMEEQLASETLYSIKTKKIYKVQKKKTVSLKMYTSAHTICVCVCVCRPTYICMYLRVYVCVCKCMCMYVCVFARETSCKI